MFLKGAFPAVRNVQSKNDECLEFMLFGLSTTGVVITKYFFEQKLEKQTLTNID